MLWSAADYSYSQNEAPELSSQFENLVSAMTRENPTQRLTVSEVLQVIITTIIIVTIIIIIFVAKMAVFNVAGYLVEEWRRRPVITASTRGQYSKLIQNFERQAHSGEKTVPVAWLD